IAFAAAPAEPDGEEVAGVVGGDLAAGDPAGFGDIDRQPPAAPRRFADEIAVGGDDVRRARHGHHRGGWSRRSGKSGRSPEEPDRRLPALHGGGGSGGDGEQQAGEKERREAPAKPS